jgi:hypothetical protein
MDFVFRAAPACARALPWPTGYQSLRSKGYHFNVVQRRPVLLIGNSLDLDHITRTQLKSFDLASYGRIRAGRSAWQHVIRAPLIHDSISDEYPESRDAMAEIKVFDI